MTKKLFALEDESEKDPSNDLLIDKILEKAKQPKSPLSLTADLLKQRENLKEEIKESLQKTEEETSDEESNTDNTDTPPDENKSNTDDSNSDSDDSKSENKEEGDDSKESLNNLIGSDLKEETPATESFKIKTTLKNIFDPLKNQFSNYKLSLETYNLQNKSVAIEEQPIVYVKESIIESMNNLISLSNSYIANNKQFIDNISSSVKNVNERVTIFKQFIDNAKYHFTNKLVNNKEILEFISVPEKSDILSTISILVDYINNTNKSINLFLNNEYEKLEDAYLNNNFVKEGEDLVYKTIVPGFNLIKLHLDDYTNYLNTNIQNYQYYKLKVLKTEDLYNLTAVEITDDSELLKILNKLDTLLVSISLSVDNLNDINTNFTKFIDELKVIIYDVEQNKYPNLANIGIDQKVKEFIMFKIAIENTYININIIIEYITSIISVLNLAIELKE